MDVITKFLHEVSWKFDKGYPDITNPKDLSFLKKLLLEYEIVLNEAATPDTENLHEIFTAMFVAGHDAMGESEFEETFTEGPNNTWRSQVGALRKLDNKDKHWEEIERWIGLGKDNKRGNDGYFAIYKDAEKLGDTLRTELGYEKDSGILEKVWRVFATGKKTKADIIVKQRIGGAIKKELLGISLKYKKGQFNSLSPIGIMKNLYGLNNLLAKGDIDPSTIDIENPKGKKLTKDVGILSQIISQDKSSGKDVKKSIDNGAKGYINFVLDNFKDISGDNKDTRKYLDHSATKPGVYRGDGYKDILDDIDAKQTIPVKISRNPEKWKDVPIKDMTWVKWRAANKNVQKAFSKAYGAKPLSEKEEDRKNIKKNTINKSLEKYILDTIDKDKKGITLNTPIKGSSKEGGKIVTFLKKILGAEEHSYYYISQGGAHHTFIPSISRLEAGTYKIEPEFIEDSADFIINLEVSGKLGESWLWLFETNIKLRFSGNEGQFTSDIAQKGSEFNFSKENIQKVFYPKDQ